jgi:CheY-like chemotaxis protein
MSIDLDAADIIVIVDDDPLVAGLISEVLRELAASVLCPTTTEAAIGLLSSSRYRLAVVDFRLPGRSGVDVAAVGARMGTPCIITTGDVEAGRTLENYQFPLVLLKPIPIAVLQGEAKLAIAQRVDVCAAFLDAAARMEAGLGTLWC